MRSRTSILISSAITLTVALLIAATPATAETRDDPVARRIVDPADLLGGYAADGMVGDFLLSNGQVAFIIEDTGSVHGDGLSGGNIVDAGVVPYWSDELSSHFTLLGDHPRQAVYDTVYVESDGTGGEAVVTAFGVDSQEPDLSVTTRYRLTADVSYLTIETTVENSGPSVSGYSAGDALNWYGGGTRFVPGYGFDITGTTTYSAWIGSAGASTSYGYTIDSGLITSTHGDMWSDPKVFSGSIPAGGSITYTRLFIAGALGLGSVSDVVHDIQGTTVGTVSGTVTSGETDEPIPNVTISCDVGGTSVYTEARSDETGHYSATLYAGNYTFNASVASYLPGSETGSITSGNTLLVDFELDPGVWMPANEDTLEFIMRPIQSIPTMLTPGDEFLIDVMAPDTTTGWAAKLTRGTTEKDLSLSGSEYDQGRERWFLTARVPSGTQPELYDLVVTASDGLEDRARQAVSVKEEDPSDYYFIHITDTHLPTHAYYYEEGAAQDSSEMDDLRAVINDINLINPAFVILTGDVVNEGELEEYLNWRAFTRTKRILREFDVPVYLVGGNHDLGGWSSTPPPDGTARRTWWRFFGWRWLYDPPQDEYIFTQNYSFDFGGVHYIGMEAYDNYDYWRHTVYGPESFTNRQMTWLANDVGTVEPPTEKILFYHYDFRREVDAEIHGLDGILYGHIHRDRGDIDDRPFDIATDNLCDGSRAMRLLRVSDGVVTPRPTFRSGSLGQNLSISYDRPNDGTESTITASVTNGLGEDFEHGLVKFHVRADSIPYAVDNGELLQTVVEGDVATCYVRLNMVNGEITTVTIDPTTGVPGGSLVLLKQSWPNPARTGTTIQYVLASPTEVSLAVYDVAGRRVASLEDGLVDAGPQEAPWDLSDEDGNTVASGVYFYRLSAGDETLTKKLIVVR